MVRLRPLASLIFLFTLAGCGDELSLEGAPCPCIDGYVCCEASDVCVANQQSCAHVGQTSWGLGQQHASCAAPVTEVPRLPPINVDATGRPYFDTWRDLTIGEFLDHGCAAQTDTDCSENDLDVCLLLGTGTGAGVCSYVDVDIWCDGEGEIFSWRDGECLLCMPIASHAAACTAGIAGVDCRSWPYLSDGKPGMVCAAHEDCEPGLICGEGAGSGYGVCQCPDLPAAPRPANDCFDALF